MEQDLCAVLPRQCYHWVWAQIWNFSSKKSYSNRLLIETSSELSCMVTRRQFGEIWVLWGELLIINGSDYLLLGLFLQGNLGITSHRHRLKRVSVCDLCGDFFPLTGAEAKAIFKVFPQSVCLSSISFFLWFPSPCFALWVPLFTFFHFAHCPPSFSCPLSPLFYCPCTSPHSPPLSSASYYSSIFLIPCLQFPSMMTSDFLRAGRTPAH